uniref:transmembrane protein 201 n=1 Tax=Myxine glutinosa TaxID=7769 RepID=UPI00358FC039
MDVRVVSSWYLAGALCTGLGVAYVSGSLLRKFRRSQSSALKEVRVECWFCGQCTHVPYGNRDCWDCPSCEQYNGFREDGDYNKPIPAQYSELLNHPVVAGRWAVGEASKGTAQWLSSRHLLCRRCVNNQQLKIRNIARFQPRNEADFDAEAELYRHYLEQIYRLCQPCQTAVDYYIKYQDRHIRRRLVNLNIPLSLYSTIHTRGERATERCIPTHVVILRLAAFFCSAMLLAIMIMSQVVEPHYGTSRERNIEESGWLHQPLNNDSQPDGLSQAMTVLHVLWFLLLTSSQVMWRTLEVAGLPGQLWTPGLLATGLVAWALGCLFAGRARLRRIDVLSSALWLLLLAIHVAEFYFTPSKIGEFQWLHLIYITVTALCAVIGLAAAVATRPPSSGRRGLEESRLRAPAADASSYDTSQPAMDFLSLSPFPPPPFLLARSSLNLFKKRPRPRASPSSLPMHLDRALSLGTTPKPFQSESSLFGVRWPSSSSLFGVNTTAEGFGSRASRPVSPAPSVLSFTTDVLHRRPLISPARLVLRPSEPSPEAGGWAPTQSCNGAGSQARVSSKVERGSQAWAGSQAGTGTRGARDLDGWSASPRSYGRDDESDDEVVVLRCPTTDSQGPKVDVPSHDSDDRSSSSSCCPVDTTTASHLDTHSGQGRRSVQVIFLALSVLFNLLLTGFVLITGRLSFTPATNNH